MSSRLLWAYPSDFRRRYGDELLATMAEVSGGRAPGLAARAHLVAWAARPFAAGGLALAALVLVAGRGSRGASAPAPCAA